MRLWWSRRNRKRLDFSFAKITRILNLTQKISSSNHQSSGKVVLYDVAKREPITSRWSFHSARVNALSWTADSQYCASGALDTHVYVWSVLKPVKNIAIRNAVPGGVNAVLWLSRASADQDSGGGRLAATGADAAVKVWQVTFHV